MTTPVTFSGGVSRMTRIATELSAGDVLRFRVARAPRDTFERFASTFGMTKNFGENVRKLAATAQRSTGNALMPHPEGVPDVLDGETVSVFDLYVNSAHATPLTLGALADLLNKDDDFGDYVQIVNVERRPYSETFSARRDSLSQAIKEANSGKQAAGASGADIPSIPLVRPPAPGFGETAGKWFGVVVAVAVVGVVAYAWRTVDR